MDVDGAQFDVAAAAPDGIEQLAAGKDAAGVFHEVAQQAEFGRTDLDRLRLRDAVRGGVERSPTVIVSPARAGRTRRSTAPTRAISSRGENGLVT
jgi:hypothetical protein